MRMNRYGKKIAARKTTGGGAIGDHHPGASENCN